MSKYERTRGYFPATTYSGVIMETAAQRGGGPNVAGAQLFAISAKNGAPAYREVQLTRWNEELLPVGTVMKVYGEPIAVARNGPESPYMDLEINVQKIAECEMPESHADVPPPPLRRQRAPGGDTAPVASTFAQDPNKVEDW